MNILALRVRAEIPLNIHVLCKYSPQTALGTIVYKSQLILSEGLQIYEHWDWSVRCPVVRLDFGSGDFKEPDYLHANLMAQSDAIEEDAEVESRYDTGPERFRHLIRTLHRRTGQRVTVLVDEYDNPILDALEEPDIARANRD